LVKRFDLEQEQEQVYKNLLSDHVSKSKLVLSEYAESLKQTEFFRSSSRSMKIVSALHISKENEALVNQILECAHSSLTSH
jgi:hypothetical protein